MPDKVISFLCRPRNLRLMVFALVAATAIFSTIYVLTGLFGNQTTVPTPTTQQESTILQGDYVLNQDTITHNSDRHSHPTETTETRNYGHQLPVRNRTRQKLQLDKCNRGEGYVPDMDSNNIYPTLPFDAKWVESREYWNTFFEERYNKLRQSTEKPYLKVFVIPHSHTDPGWLYTFEEYFQLQTKNIIDNAVDKLEELPLMKFQLSEISFLAKWYKYAHPSRRAALKKFVKEGRLEIATGGWVMTDEAVVSLYAMIDQLVEGHQWVKAHLGVVPKTSWSVDPFGHGSTFPYILNAAGINGMVVQRIHYAWKKYFAEQQTGDFNWVQRWDSTKGHSILCHNAPFDIYSIKHSCGPHPQTCLNFDFRSIIGEYSENSHIMQPITKGNIKEKAELLMEQYWKAASLFKHNVIMVSLGDDFRYSHQTEWNQQYYNYLALFNYINSNKEIFRAELSFGTISEYFKSIRSRSESFPTFSGDFFVYSDIFSEGRPAYWSGYFGTRPYWKKFYRETENALRSAEILYSFATALARQKTQLNTLQIMNQEYANLEVARQWMGLFAHHDAVTGTSKARTMDDYGMKLLDAKQNSMKIQMLAISSILFGQIEDSHLSLDYDQSTFANVPKKVPLRPNSNEERIILFNSLGWRRSHLTKVVVKTPYVQVTGPSGENIVAQINPIMDFRGSTPVISSAIFELLFIANLAPLSISTFTIKMVTERGENTAVISSIYCKNCTAPRVLFEVNSFQPGNIQLTSDRMQLLFDRDTGFLLGIKKLQGSISINAKLSFGLYASVDFKSGAYLLKLDTPSEPQSIPFSSSFPKIFIVSGPVSSELSVSSDPLLISTQIMHSGGETFEEGIYIQSKVNLGLQKGELFMRFDTELNSTTASLNSDNSLPTFYTDQNGFTVEKRTKIEAINIEGNYYPVNTLAYLQDEDRGLRFSILVDRAHGFSSFEKGRLETIIERRTLYDDARGMGEGVTDNRETISNYIIIVEKIREIRPENEGKRMYEELLPTLKIHHLSQSLNYPPSLFILDYENYGKKSQSTTRSFSLLSQEIPCDTHLINLRTMTEERIYDIDINLPSTKALMIIQKLAYYCLSNEDNGIGNCGNGNTMNQSLFYVGTGFNLVTVKEFIETSLTGIDNRTFRIVKDLSQLQGDPFEIKSLILKF